MDFLLYEILDGLDLGLDLRRFWVRVGSKSGGRFGGWLTARDYLSEWDCGLRKLFDGQNIVS